MSVRDIQVFISFTTFYQCCIQSFSKIAAPLTLMLKTIGSSKELALRAFEAGNNKVVGGVCGRANGTVVNLSQNEKSRKSTYMPNIRATRKPNFPNLDAKKAFNYLRLAFIKASIF